MSSVQVLQGSEIEGGLAAIKNYITNPNAHENTAGWATYDDGASATPVNGTGGSPTLTFTRTTSSPLRGTGSFLITTTAADLQGEGASFDFAIDSADQAKVMSISFDYNIASGTYVTGDMTVYIYDVTNALVIQPAGYQIQAVGSTLPNKHIATFQTSSNSTSYRLIFHRAVATASAMTMKIDNVVLGPQVVQYGAIVESKKDYPTTTGIWKGVGSDPVIGNGSIAAKYRRIGDSVTCEITIRLGTTTTLGSGDWYFLIPTTMAIDTAKLSYTGSGTVLGHGVFFDDSTATQYNCVAEYISGANGVRLFMDGTGGALDPSSPVVPANLDIISLIFTAPVLGFESTVQMSNDTDARVVAAQYTSGTATIAGFGGANALKFASDSKITDSHSAYDSSTGRYTAPFAGWYAIGSGIKITGTEAADQYIEMQLKVNGTTKRVALTRVQAASLSSTTAYIDVKSIYLNAGDYVEIMVDSSVTGATISAGTNNYFDIFRLSGPSAIAASEFVCAKATGVPTGTITGSVASCTTAIFPTEEFDTHGAYDPTTGIFTVPVAGYYRVTSFVSVASTEVVDTYVIIVFRKNSGSVQYSATRITATGLTSVYATGSNIIKCVAGDTLTIRVSSGSTSPVFEVGETGQYIIFEKVN